MPKIESPEQLEQMMEGGGGSGGLPIIRVKDDLLTVRFLEEPTEWSYYDSYFDTKNQTSVVIQEGEKAPKGTKPRTRWLANVLVKDGEDKVLALEMPATLAQQVYNRWVAKGTITDRDFEMSRRGSGLKTKYSAAPEAPKKINLGKYASDLHDLEDIIERIATWDAEEQTADVPDEDEVDEEEYEEEEYDDADEDGEEYEDDEEFPEEDEEESDEEEYEEEEYEDDEEAEEEADEEESEYWTKAELAKMKVAELRALATEAGWNPTGYSKADLVEALAGE